MKRRKLVKHLQTHGGTFLREGQKHSVFWMPATGLQTTVPRHAEIGPGLVKKICKDLDLPTPKEK